MHTIVMRGGCLGALVLGALLGACGGGTDDAADRAIPAHAPSVVYSGDRRIDALLTPADAQWNWNYVAPGRPLRYTFDPSGVASGLEQAATFNADQRAAARAILQQAGAVTGIAFVEAADARAAELLFVAADLGADGAFGSVRWSTSRPVVEIVLNSAASFSSWLPARTVEAPGPGSVGYVVLLHEIGHALGLKHPHEGRFVLPADEATMAHTVMTSVRLFDVQPRDFQPYDKLALRWIYGGDGLGGERGFNSSQGPSVD